MPFNSSQNSIFSDQSPEVSFHTLKNSYAIPKEGYNQLPYTLLTYRPTAKVDNFIKPANVHSNISYLNNNELNYINEEQKKQINKEQKKLINKDEELIGDGIGNFKSAKNRVNKTVNRVIENVDDNTIKVGGSIFKKVKKVAKKVGQKTLDSVNPIKGVKDRIDDAQELNKRTKPLQKSIVKSTVDKDGLIHQGISATLDQVPKALGAATGAAVTAYTGNPMAGAVASKAVTYGADLGRKELDKKQVMV